KEDEYSISHHELKAAVKGGKQVYIFIQKNVLNEYTFYKANRDIKDIKWVSVDDPRVFEFISEIEALPKNNATFPFETSQEISQILRDDFAGLSQRLLQRTSKMGEINANEKLHVAAKTLDHLAEYFRNERAGESDDK